MALLSEVNNLSLLLNAESFYINCLNLSKNFFNYNFAQAEIKPIIWVGYSGGADSRVLLELANKAFKERGYTLNAVYINHKLSKNADYWQQHCQDVCQELGVNFTAIDLSIDPQTIKSISSIENFLRNQRIKIWHNLVSPNDLLLLGHHLNDQIETIFLRLIRGSGIAGLAGIRSANRLGNIKVIRPLLNFSKQQLLEFAATNQLNYVEDESNHEIRMDRNFIRHQLIPRLLERWSNSLNNINRSIDKIQQVDVYLTNVAMVKLQSCYKYVNYFYVNYYYQNLKVLCISRLLLEEYFWQVQILRQFIINHGFQVPSANKINQIYREIINAKIDRQPLLEFNNYVIVRYRDHLYVYGKNSDWIDHNNCGFYQKLGGLIIMSGKNILDRNYQAKKIFQKFAIPPWLRHSYQLVILNDELIAILGLWIKGIN